jgi:phosphatidylinositol alpha-mannosyltransferase
MGTVPKALKIGLVVDDGLDNPDGVQQYILAVGEWLSRQGHNVHYLVGQTARQDVPNVHSISRNIKVRFNGNRLSIPLPTSRAKIRAFLAREQFDVLHIQMPHSPFMAQRVVLAAAPGTAIIGTFHVLPYTKLSSMGNRALGTWLKPSLKRFDEIVSVSPAAAAFARSSFGIETAVVPNVVDYGRFRDAQPLKAYQDDTLTILFLGRLVPRKGCLLLLQAVRQLATRDSLPKFRVLICGKGPLEAKLRQFITYHSLENIVELAGFVNEADKPRYYASADVAVFPARGGESFGIVLIEALASGRAVVLAGDNPGYRSVMAPQPELLFDAANANLLAEKLAYYLSHPAERQQMRAWGQEYAKQFDVGVVAGQLLEIYRRALHKRREA